MSKAKKPDKEIVGKYVELQAQTACRKCKKKDWKLEDGFDLAEGGDRVGIFVVLGSRDDVVNVGTFTCNGCSAKFARPFYSREQLAVQEYPAIQLDEPKKAEPGKTKRKTKTDVRTDPNLN